MADTTDIEKKSLEAHVELCAERYRFLEEKLESMEEKITSVVTSVSAVKTAVESMATKNNDRLINWGIGIIVALVGTVGWLLQHYVLS
jgi:prefoldin subunit 5